jgi:hypothetical protein
MKSEDEIVEKLRHKQQSQMELVRKSSESPCLPDGSEDTDHIMAVSNKGFISALEWVLDGEENDDSV